jgi:tetratricopeptide (TPR) repeat protein
LKGAGDRDKDGVVRAGELLDYLSQVVPEQTSALQHPRAAGNLDARLPLAIISKQNGEPASGLTQEFSSPNPTAPERVSLEVRAPAGSEVYVNSTYRGRVRPEGVLAIDGLSKGTQEISIDFAGAETIKQSVSVTTAKTVLDLNVAVSARAAVKSSPLVAQIREAISKNNVLEPGGAWPLYQRLTNEAPNDPQRVSVEVAMIGELDKIGQQSINNYVRTSASQFDAARLRQASQAYANLKTLKAGDQHVEAKSLFAAARVKLAEGKPKEAIALLEKAMSIDPKTACPYNALGVAYEKTNDVEKALNFYKRAVQLAPGWALPHYRLGLQYFARGKAKDAQKEFEASKDLDPAFLLARWWNAHAYSEQGRYAEGEREAKELIALAPNYTPAFVELGMIYQAARRFDNATEIFNEYLRVSSVSAAKQGSNSTDNGSQNNKVQTQSPKSK